ncbi:GTP cyclohydrolase I [Natronolimnohabitans sp. A-GB9]|uniref:GTP cyclohydrolase I n=1 Tax=Natronolimnohabitans sp. A-GB9 TaxID=3069757 RepID=UPI0027B3F20E|nr:GTP cyclohydrolase I [Natronolimnohabitans sp. A-GB9]MDQ2052181.1 GTP cyclohydrolase I [Natronolimnohabitans sp. A-GB9]
MGSENQRTGSQHTAIIGDATTGSTSFDEQKAREGTKLLLEAVGMDPTTDDVTDTWQRRVPDVLETLTVGMRAGEKPEMRTFETRGDGLVTKTGIPVNSLCKHHLLPFRGVAHVAYLPDTEMVGLSKLVRYIRWQSRRVTTQEALTRDIAAGLAEELDAEAVAVEITASHMCEAMRGVEVETETTTRERIGDLSEREWRQFQGSIPDQRP